MAVARHFLGWDGAILPAAARWLAGAAAPVGGAWDLSGFVVVTPAGRASRRLLEVLVDHAEALGVTLHPPATGTLGELADRLIAAGRPAAGATAAAVAWVRALQLSERAVLEALTPRPPEAGDAGGWLALAEDVAAVVRELAGAGLTPGAALGQLQQMTEFPDEARWAALAALHGRYLQELAAAGLADRDDARLAAAEGAGAEAGALAIAQRVVLVGAPDVPPLLAGMLRRVAAEGGARVDVLVHAPASVAEGFDDVGGLVVAYWRDRPLTVPEERLSVVDRPADAALEVVRLVSGLGAGVRADDVTVGVGDAGQARPIARALRLAGGAARVAEGESLQLTRPVLLLDALRRFVASRRFDDFAALVRHVDVERHVDDEAAVAQWLGLLDAYATEHLQGKVTGDWLGDAEAAAGLRAVYQSVVGLLPVDAEERRPLPQWAGVIGAALGRVYGRAPLSRFDDEDRPVVVALEHVGGALRELATLPLQWTNDAGATVAEALALVQRVAGAGVVPAEGGAAAVEVLGWLELPHDDAPHLVLTGLSEKLIPTSVHGDALLPDAARRRLGLTDNARRLARDALLLETILNSRPDVRLIATRRDEEGQTTPPSRLLLRGDARANAARLLRFFGDEPAAPRPRPLLPHGASTFVVPPPPRGPHVLTGLSVTAFADYLACPYRFYLRHVLRLATVDDAALELGGDHFGQLAHHALEQLGRAEDVASAQDDDAVARFLIDALRRAARERFGAAPSAAVAIQIRRMELRLRRVARWHVEQVRAGWRVSTRHTERERKAVIDIDGEPFELRGRIDRVDVHDTHGYRVIDYKTADRGADPEQDHRCGPAAGKRWTSLQLPLYRVLLRGGGLPGACTLGYVRLAKDATIEPFAAAEWSGDELDEAESVAVDVVRAIRAGVFWPPGEPSAVDGLADVCMDELFDRAEAMARAKRLYEGGGTP